MGEAGGAAPSLPFVVFGIDHHRTPVDLREKLAVPTEGITKLLALLSTTPGANEAVVLSTCNRLECYLAGMPDRQQVLNRLAEHQGVDAAMLETHAFWHPGMEGVRHLFRSAVVAQDPARVLELRHPVLEDEERIAQSNLIADPEDLLVDGLVVDEGAVPAVEVADEEHLADAEDFRVTARDTLV